MAGSSTGAVAGCPDALVDAIVVRPVVRSLMKSWRTPPVEVPDSAALDVMSTYRPSGENAAPCTEDDAVEPSGSRPRRDTSPVAANAAMGARARAPAAAITAARGMG